MTADELAALHPRLYHLAEDGAWPSIRAHGLLSTSALLHMYGLEGEAREAVEARRRPMGVTLAAPGLPGARVRDQKPMTDAALRRCLDDGLVPSDWYLLLNRRVFLFPTRKRLDALLKAYEGQANTVLTLDTASLVAVHGDAVELSPYNSGTTARNAPRRGWSTFLPLARYPFAAWRAKRSAGTAIAEVTVPGGVPDVERHALLVERVLAGARSEIWRRPGWRGEAPS